MCWIEQLRKERVVALRDDKVALLEMVERDIHAELKENYGADNENVHGAIIAAIERV